MQGGQKGKKKKECMNDISISLNQGKHKSKFKQLCTVKMC